MLLAAAAAFRLYRIAGQLNDAQAVLRSAEASVREGELGRADEELGRAEQLVAAANGSLHTSPELSVASIVPIARENLSSLRRSVEITLRLTNGGRRVLTAARPLQGPDGRLQVSLRAGAVPLQTAREAGGLLKEVAYSLPELSGSSRRWLVGPVRQLHDDVLAESLRRRRQFISVGRGLELLTELAGGSGPRRYMLAVANAAEMRGTGGMVLSYGSLTSDAGKMALERFGPIDELMLAQAVPTTEPADYLRRFESFSPTRLWRNVNLAGDFTLVAPIMERMYTAATGAPVDGVVQIDSVGLAAILEGIGPVDVPGLGTVNKDNVVAVTLNDAYVRFPDRPVRQDFLEAVARTSFERLLSGDYPSVTALAGALVRAAEGRHVILHATEPSVERLIATLGADGSLPPPGVNFAALTVQNLSGNKLDYYIDTKLGVTGSVRPGRASRLKLAVTITNTAPANGVPQYVFGPLSPAFQAGEYRGLASVYLPAGSVLTGQEGSDGRPAVASEGGRTVVSYGIDLQAGETRTAVLDVLLPAQPPAEIGWVLPASPRVRPTVVTMALDTPGGTLRFDGPVDRTVVRSTR